MRKQRIVDQNGRRCRCPRRRRWAPTGTMMNIEDDSDEQLSDTESEHLETQSRVRRLRLTWRENQNVEWHRDARLAECLVRDVATRIGSHLPGAQIPAAVRRQRCSPLIVPLVWAAAGQEDSIPALQWLTHVLSEAPQVEFHGNHMGAARAVEVRWNSLKEAWMWGVTARGHLTLWLTRHGFACSAVLSWRNCWKWITATLVAIRAFSVLGTFALLFGGR